MLYKINKYGDLSVSCCDSYVCMCIYYQTHTQSIWFSELGGVGRFLLLCRKRNPPPSSRSISMGASSAVFLIPLPPMFSFFPSPDNSHTLSWASIFLFSFSRSLFVMAIHGQDEASTWSELSSGQPASQSASPKPSSLFSNISMNLFLFFFVEVFLLFVVVVVVKKNEPTIFM